MPISKKRKSLKPAFIPPNSNSQKPVKFGSPVWLVPTMVSFFVLGLLWIVIFYLAGNQIPIMQDFSNLINILIGFGFIGVGFALATKWH